MSGRDYGDAYSKHFRRTVNLLISRGAPREAAEEASQAAWVLGWECLHQLRNQQLLATWVNTVALNCYRRMLRHMKQEEAVAEIPGSCTIDFAALDLAKILSLCSEAHRALLQQRLVGRTIDEMARDLGTTNMAVRIRLRRARQKAHSAALSSTTNCRGPIENSADGPSSHAKPAVRIYTERERKNRASHSPAC
jgi:DNA-directed RNA polymerase specialized sigma24 family protein